MRKNKLIKTNSLWYKVRHFFNNLKSRLLEKRDKEKEDKILLDEDVKGTYNNEFNDIYKKSNLIKRVLNREITIHELSDNEIDEITETIEKDIDNMEKELLKIKQNILIMKQKLNK